MIRFGCGVHELDSGVIECPQHIPCSPGSGQLHQSASQGKHLTSSHCDSLGHDFFHSLLEPLNDVPRLARMRSHENRELH